MTFAVQEISFVTDNLNLEPTIRSNLHICRDILKCNMNPNRIILMEISFVIDNLNLEQTIGHKAIWIADNFWKAMMNSDGSDHIVDRK